METRRFWAVLGASAAVLTLVLILAPLAGSSPVSLTRVWNGDSPDRDIFFMARLPRVLMSALTGLALAVAGVLFQALLRDALATPYTLGVSSGASLGAVIAIVSGFTGGVWMLAIVGAAATLGLVLALGREGNRLSSFTLLLAGVTLNSIAIALILFLQNLTTFGRSLAIMRWLMGGIEAESYTTIGWLATVTVPLSILVFTRARDWNLLSIGEEWAAARGVETRRALLAGFLAGSVLTGLVTAFTGPIGFVGLIVPHALRLWLGADHRLLVPSSALLGAAFLCVCDTAARVVMSPVELPVGVITAMLGGPFFIWLLRSKRRSLWL